MCFFKWINCIKLRIPLWIWKIIFVLSSYEFLAMLEGKIGKGPFFRVQSDEFTVSDPSPIIQKFKPPPSWSLKKGYASTSDNDFV